eukprot:scaffold349786_cov34-Prasinocladus_malaysianus.AAC.1
MPLYTIVLRHASQHVISLEPVASSIIRATDNNEASRRPVKVTANTKFTPQMRKVRKDCISPNNETVLVVDHLGGTCVGSSHSLSALVKPSKP